MTGLIVKCASMEGGVRAQIQVKPTYSLKPKLDHREAYESGTVRSRWNDHL